jgi:hypothetical protein
MMSPRPAVETMEFIPLDGGGTRVEHRLRVEKRGVSLLWHRATILFLRAGTPIALSTLKTIMDEDAAALESNDPPSSSSGCRPIVD